GGIGTGTISLGGRGNFRDWEIFNRPGKGVNLPFTFFALYVEQGGTKRVRVLEGPLTPPFTTGFGFRREDVPGLPRMEKARFKGEYPFAEVELSDSQIPLSVTLEAFNPYIPLEPEDSGIPAVVLRWRIRNTGPSPAKVTVAASILNPVGYDGEGAIGGLGNEKFGQNVNELRKTATLRGLAMSSNKVKPGSPAAGTMALTTPWPDVTFLTHWVRGEWWDDLQIFWDDFSADGRLKDLVEVSPSPDKQSDIGTLGLVATIQPGAEVSLPFILSWNFANVLDYFDVVPEQRGKIYKNHYGERFPDAWAAAEYLQANLERLEKESRRFHDAFFGSTLPSYVLDAVSSQAAIIRTPTCFWLEGGAFFGFEGCGDQSGCCPLNCAHVWNYAQSLAFLYPTLERSMRETDFLNNVKPDGAMMFRTSLPLGSGVYWNFKPAADGQMGRIISLYRDWQISGDTAWLQKLWPKAKKAMEYAWVSWDANRDGLMEGEQHNTYDIEFYGPNSMMGAFYLGALKAATEMAAALADWPAAKAFREMYDKGRLNYDKVLWNGEYYVQKSDPIMEKKYQYGEGCLSDQLLGQWLGMVSGLGRYLPQDRIRSALGAIYKYNFKTDFREFSNVQRTYALGDEKGLLLCSWPRGGRPPLPFVYSDEVWTGIEYQVASHLIYEGLVDEGLSVVKAARDRYDGR
ncbi:MAG TPA: GH116 family glycosyl-hydrolase, partial [Burkholderiales bacterium]|nr:GH116 family glycosyl-hydrolase [Burkholderiales bacterium]